MQGGVRCLQRMLRSQRWSLSLIEEHIMGLGGLREPPLSLLTSGPKDHG